MWKWLLVVCILLISLGVNAAKNNYVLLSVFTKALHIVQQYYVEEVETKSLIYGAIKGMLKELDPHTHFLSDEMYKSFQSSTSGEFGGLGIEVTLKNEVLTVLSAIEDSQAWKAGVQAGDKIITINNEPIKGLSLSEIGQRLRGKIGTTVKIKIVRQSEKNPKTFEIKRGHVVVHSVKYIDLDSGYAYFKITSFIKKTYDDFEDLLIKHKNKKNGLKGIILDLRNNPGGLFDQAVKVTDLFIDKGVLVSIKGKDKSKNDTIYAKSNSLVGKGFPVIILINEYSASASEIVAGALQDHNRALVMGRRSFGKGSIQSLVRFDDGSALKITVARYYTPNGQSIQAQGITPNVKIDPVDLTAYKKALKKHKIKRESDIKGTLKKEEGKPSQVKNNPSKKNLLDKDFDVLTAYNYLTAYQVFKTSNKASK